MTQKTGHRKGNRKKQKQKKIRNILISLFTAIFSFTLAVFLVISINLEKVKDLGQDITLSFFSNIGSSSTEISLEHLAEAEAVPSNGKSIFLTFDDGPGPHTMKLLDLLDEYKVKATFFVTYSNPQYTHIIGEIHRRGHVVALHTATHDYSNVYASLDNYYADLLKLQDICYEQTGVRATLVRFPGGTANSVSKRYCPGIMTAIVNSFPEKGFRYCDWNVSSGDAGVTATTDSVYENVTTQVPNYTDSYVLMHDTHDFTIEAVDDIIIWGKEQGYLFRVITDSVPVVHQSLNN